MRLVPCISVPRLPAPQSFADILSYMDAVKRAVGTAPLLAVVGCKTDMAAERSVSEQDQMRLAEQCSMFSFFSSSLTGDGVLTTLYRVAANLVGMPISDQELERLVGLRPREGPYDDRGSNADELLSQSDESRHSVPSKYMMHLSEKGTSRAQEAARRSMMPVGNSAATSDALTGAAAVALAYSLGCCRSEAAVPSVDVEHRRQTRNVNGSNVELDLGSTTVMEEPSPNSFCHQKSGITAMSQVPAESIHLSASCHKELHINSGFRLCCWRSTET